MDTNSDSDIDVNENFDSNIDNVDNNEELEQYGGAPRYGESIGIGAVGSAAAAATGAFPATAIPTSFATTVSTAAQAAASLLASPILPITAITTGAIIFNQNIARRNDNYNDLFKSTVSSIYILDSSAPSNKQFKIENPNRVTFSEFQQFFKKELNVSIKDIILSRVDKKYKHGFDENIPPGIVRDTKVEHLTKLLQEGDIGRGIFESNPLGNVNRDHLIKMAESYEFQLDTDKYWATFTRLKDGRTGNMKFDTNNDLIFMFKNDHDIDKARNIMTFEELNSNDLQLINIKTNFAIPEIANRINEKLKQKQDPSARATKAATKDMQAGIEKEPENGYWASKFLPSIIIVRDGRKHISDFTLEDITISSVDYTKPNYGFLDAYKKFVFINKILLNYDSNFNFNIEDIFTNYNENLKKIIEKLHDKIIKEDVNETYLHNVYPLIHDKKKIIEEDFVENIGNELYQKNVVDLKSINLEVPGELLDIQNYPNSNPTSAPNATTNSTAHSRGAKNANHYDHDSMCPDKMNPTRAS